MVYGKKLYKRSYRNYEGSSDLQQMVRPNRIKENIVAERRYCARLWSIVYVC
jgi:hypothetical protein